MRRAASILHMVTDFQAAENKAVQLARKCVQTKYMWFKTNQAHDNLSSQFYGEGVF